MRSVLFFATLLAGGHCTPEVPEHLRGGFLGRTAPPLVSVGLPHRISVPLDHFTLNSSDTFLRYWVADSSWSKKPEAPLFIEMPSEGPGRGLYADQLTRTFEGIRIGSEHRYFGDSVPCPDGVCESTTENLVRYMTVEQNLADQMTLVQFIKQKYGLTGPVIATGGSYAGASAAWFRTAYPSVVSAALAESGPILATVDFYEYDNTLYNALSYKEGCAEGVAATMKVLNSMFLSDPDALKRAFNGSSLIGKHQGDTDLLYFIGDSVATSVQYGNKAKVCEYIARLPAAPSPAQYLAVWQQYSHDVLGPTAITQACFYNSECMARTEGSTSARSWYFLKCSEIAYLQTAPSASSRPALPAMRPAALTVDRLLEQCKYIYGPGLPAKPRVEAFNAKFGGLHPEATNVNQTNVAYFIYSDDPWKAAQPTTSLGETLQVISTVCDGCAHCGAGVPSKKIAELTDIKISLLKKWLNL